MDLRTLMIISTLLIMTAGSDQTSFGPGVTETSLPTRTNSNTTPAASTAPTFSPNRLAPALGLFTVGWTSECEGDVKLLLHQPSSSPLPVCYDSVANVQSLLRLVCQNKKGCTGTPRWDKGRDTLNGYCIRESGAEAGNGCETLRVKCTAEIITDLWGQLQAHKVMTALLCCVLLVLLLIRFGRPTIKALQKRLSERRQNRWIGPTQSHSVSYHREKAAVKINDGEKRLSYPALERLTVSDSREPSSNRNSGYNI